MSARQRDKRITRRLSSAAADRQRVQPDSGKLVQDGLLHQHDFGRHGAPTPNVYALGPPARGLLWEATAVPDIRKQCAQFATWLAEEPATAAAWAKTN
jgi:uncharacterized NAD(P)/FAD-binding protein YdhS